MEEARLPTTEIALRRRFEGTASARVAIEVGSQSPWISRLLEELGHEVIVANSLKLRLIYKNESKTDRADAEYLARLAAADPSLLHPVRHRGKKAQADRAVLVARDHAVACRTKLINSIRGLAKSLGQPLVKCAASSFHNKVRDQVPDELAAAVEPLLEVVSFLTDKIRVLDRVIQSLCKDYAETARLQQIHGVGPILALDYVLKIEDPMRFADSRKVGSYVGLRPRKHESGSRDPELRITKSGDPMLRRHLVQSAQYILGPFGRDSDLRRKGLKLAGRGGKAAKKRAVIAVARKLAVLLHRLWISGEVYEPLRNSARTGETVLA